jgi:hypothetical protein
MEELFMVRRRDVADVSCVEGSEKIKIDPAMAQRRLELKRGLMQQPASKVPEDPFEWLSKEFPCFSESYWSLAAAIRWIADRTEESVNGVWINEDQLQPSLTELQKALNSGAVRSWGLHAYNPVSQELPRETWYSYELAARVDDLDRIAIYPERNGAEFEPPRLQNLRVARDDMVRCWSVPGDPPPISTIGAQRACTRWLKEEMSKNPSRPTPKAEMFSQALARFPGLSGRGFVAAWAESVRATGATKWSRPGRKKNAQR